MTMTVNCINTFLLHFTITYYASTFAQMYLHSIDIALHCY